jgi:uncharacterized protein GlcG (DUF336 family)
MLKASEKKACSMDLAMDIAICDEGGNLLAFHRMDGAKITSIEVAIGKAFTSAGSRLPTSKYAEVAGAGKPAFGIHASNRGRFMIFGGGLPITIGGEHLGGIGCSSGSVDEDAAVAQAGIDALIAAMTK